MGADAQRACVESARENEFARESDGAGSSDEEGGGVSGTEGEGGGAGSTEMGGGWVRSSPYAAELDTAPERGRCDVPVLVGQLGAAAFAKLAAQVSP